MTNVRSEIPAKYKWDLSAIYPDLAAFDADFAKAEKLVADFPRHDAGMKASAEGLYAMLTDLTALDRLINKLYEYAGLSYDLDTGDNAFLALRGRVLNLYNDMAAATFFVSPNLIAMDGETLEKWFAEYPALEEYRRSIECEQRYKPHTLSDECEKLLADLSAANHSHSDIRTVFANADISFGKVKGEEGKTVELTDATYVPLLHSADRNVRRAAFVKLYQTYAQFGNTFTALYNAYVKEQVTHAKVRRFPDSLTASVFRDEVTPEIYNNLIATVEKNLPTLFRYYDLKKEVMGLPKLHLYDIYTPLIASCNREYSFEEAVDTVLDTVKIFGEEYYETLKKGLLEEGWVDVYPTKGKRGGAYSAGCFDTKPYMLLNYGGKLDDVSTLAHEAGHSMHSHFSIKYNTPQESSYTIFVAEVASTVNELLFAHKKLRESKNRDEKLDVLNQLMETYKGTLFRQTMFASFEKTVHKAVEDGATLTKDMMCDTYYKLVKKYFGPRVVCDKQIALEWMRIPHFYTNFYVYKYATCISAASYIVKRIETEGEEYMAKYLNFLKAGGSKSPLESLLIAEVDLTKPEVIENAIRDFSDVIDEFRAIYSEE